MPVVHRLKPVGNEPPLGKNKIIERGVLNEKCKDYHTDFSGSYALIIV